LKGDIVAEELDAGYMSGKPGKIWLKFGQLPTKSKYTIV